MNEVIIASSALDHIGDEFDKRHLPKRVVVFFDTNTARLFGNGLKTTLKKAEFNYHLVSVAANETAKSFRNAERVYGNLIAAGIDRSYAVLAVGGGVVGDFAGFIAASYLRGLPLIHVPTTLLAMVDSSIGGKVAINHAQGKNLIGFFYPPMLTLIDKAFLNALPTRDVYSGLAEALKYALISDEPFLRYIERHFERIAALQSPHIDTVIKKSVRAKQRVVTLDFKETMGLRATLNFGHTFGHALEKIARYKYLRHGEAVLFGMCCAASLSHAVGNIDEAAFHRIIDLAKRFPIKPSTTKKYFLDVPPKAMLENMSSDKKKSGGRLRFVLLRQLGKAYLSDDAIEAAVIVSAIRAAQQAMAL